MVLIRCGAFSFLLNALNFMDTTTGPVGFYPENPSPFEYAGQLWTLRFEIFVYFLAPILYLIGRLTKPWFIIALTIFAGALVLIIIPSDPKPLFIQHHSHSFAPLIRLCFCFLLGTILWQERRNAFVFLILGLLGMMALGFFPATTLIGDLAISLSLFVPALGLTLLSQRYLLPKGLKSIPDLSYGVFLWHYPIMQILWGSFEIRSSLPLFFCSVLLSLMAAALSWSFVEKPALGLKRRISVKTT